MTEPMGRDAEERSGWRIQRAADAITKDLIVVRVSKDDFAFMLSAEMYDDLDDEAFLGVCEHQLAQLRREQ